MVFYGIEAFFSPLISFNDFKALMLIMMLISKKNKKKKKEKRRRKNKCRRHQQQNCPINRVHSLLYHSLCLHSCLSVCAMHQNMMTISNSLLISLSLTSQRIVYACLHHVRFFCGSYFVYFFFARDNFSTRPQCEILFYFLLLHSKVIKFRGDPSNTREQWNTKRIH